MSQTTVVEGRPISWLGVVSLGLGSVMAVAFVAGFALPYLMFNAEVLARFAGREPWVFCWAVPLLTTEAIIQGRKVLGSAQTHSA